MAFHLRSELPEPVMLELNHETPELTPEEVRILKSQIRLNAIRIQEDVRRLELFLIKEKYPQDTVFIDKIRKNLKLSMEENDTFRKALWNHCQSADVVNRFRKRSS